MQDVTLPILEQLFTIVLLRLGPRTPLPHENFALTSAQEAAVDNLAEIQALFEARESVRKTFRQAMPKTMYWLGTSVLLNHIMQHCWPHALGGTLPEAVPAQVSDGAFCSAVAFVHRRYAYGHAVLSVSVQEAAWMAPDSFARKGADDIMPTVLKVLRSNPGSCVTFDHVLQAQLGLKRVWSGAMQRRGKSCSNTCSECGLLLRTWASERCAGKEVICTCASWLVQPCPQPQWRGCADKECLCFCSARVGSPVKWTCLPCRCLACCARRGQVACRNQWRQERLPSRQAARCASVQPTQRPLRKLRKPPVLRGWRPPVRVAEGQNSPVGSKGRAHALSEAQRGLRLCLRVI